MKTSAATILSATVFLSISIGIAQAEVCYKLTPFIDVLRLNEMTFVDSDAAATHTLVSGNWIARGFYTLPVVGSEELDSGSTSVRRLGIHGTQHTSFFGGHSDCVLDGLPGGAWSLSCDGKVTSKFNNNGGSLAPISCGGLVTAAEEAGKPAGQ